VSNAYSGWLLAAAVFCNVLIVCTRLNAQKIQQAPSGSDAKIRVAVNSVVVPVVVRDAQGRAVGGLKQEDFQVFDNNKTHSISGFSVKRRGGNVNDLLNPGASPVPSGTSQTLTGAPARFIVFLFDDMHLEPGDLLRAQTVATKMIGGSLTDSDMALVISFSGTNTGFTRDHVKLVEAIRKLKVQNLYRHAGRECPDVSYYQGNLIVNQHNEQASEAAVEDAKWCAHLDPKMTSVAEGMAAQAARRAVAIGDQDVRVTLDFVRNLAHKLGALPGERRIVLVSPGFLTITPEAMAEKSQVLDAAAESDVTISALDARGLYTTVLDASERGANTALDLENAGIAQNHSKTVTLGEDVLSELADGTGGTYFHDSNDLEGGLQKLSAGPEYIYMIELSLEKVKQDGAYHRLTIKLDKDGLKVQARRGYSAPKKGK
jgi:VWFA-related protein